MLHDDLLNTIDYNSAMVVIENSLITGEKIKNQTQLKQVVTHLCRFYSFYRHKKDTPKYIDLFVALIKNCLQPKLYVKELLLDKIISIFYYYRGYDDVIIDFDKIYIVNINQGWIPDENYITKLITDKKITYDCVLIILKKITSLPKKILLNCSDLFAPVFGKVSNKLSQQNISISGYGKSYKNETYTENEHLLFLQKFCEIDINEFYSTVLSLNSNYIIQRTSITEIYRSLLKQFNDDNFKISNKLFLLINKEIAFDVDNVKEYIDLVKKLSISESITFYISQCHSFKIIFLELINQNKIDTINDFEVIKPLLISAPNKTLEIFDYIYFGEKNKNLLLQIIQSISISTSTSTSSTSTSTSSTSTLSTNLTSQFIKDYIINNSIEIDDDLFVSFANANLKDILEYCFENKYQLSDNIVLQMHSIQIYDQLKLANNYNYYITDNVFNHVHQLLFYCSRSVEDICSMLKSISIYKNEEDKDFIEKKQKIITYHSQLISYKNGITICFNDNITPEMIVNADKASIRYYLLNKFLKQQKINYIIDHTTESPKPIIKKVIKRVVKKIVKKTPENVIEEN
jgi:hypothetical protein